MSSTVITIIILVAVAYGVFMVFYMKKYKATRQKYAGDDALAQAPHIQDELMRSHFLALKEQMQGAPVDAFTQCAYITTVGNKMKSAAATAAKTAAWAMVGVKARYHEADNAAYLVLSGDNLHYLFFEEGEAKEHLIFDRFRLLSAKTAAITNAEKVTRLSSVMGQKPLKMSMDIEGNNTDVIYYGEVRRPPESALYGEGIMKVQGMGDLQGKFGLMGRYFKKKFYEQYPHLSA
ncbi:hypothetical protein [Chitinophaga barathri]|uniref:Uncharacterized protein n=1 Tax=Chitinophaga barathri TaxID=1647451 RepID=A0A3N4M7Z7_9BACT|nr:hypothetical protein [Chitinophaga barathri]RPD39632.1 hypothetical protein EG028_18475 [Chitinophaga barathri]